MKSRSKGPRLLAYFYVPVIFGLLGYLIFYLAFQPVWNAALATTSFLITEDISTFNSNLSTIYNPDAQKIEPATVDKSEAAENVQPYLNIEDIVLPASGTQYAWLSCDRIQLDAPVYWYDSYEILAYGVGQSVSSFMPGFGRLILLSAHNTTYFKCLEYIETGDVITFDTHYGTYEYQVMNVQVMNENELEELLYSKLLSQKEELIMYTCYPFYAISTRKTDRLTVFAERISGYDVKWRDMDEAS